MTIFEGIFVNGEKGEGDPSSNHTFDLCSQNNGGNNTLSCTKTIATDPSDQKPICDFSDQRSDICELSGTIRIHGNSSSIIFSPSNPSQQRHSWTIKPHPRKGDQTALAHVTEITVKSSPNQNQTPPCSINHTIPCIVFSSIVFSTGGYMGNLFHDFTDILIPLFITATSFRTQVQFIISNVQPWWLAKYKPYLHQLSSHEIIKFDDMENVLCFPRAIVGLRKHREMGIDSSRAPNSISMADFAATMRKSYGLERHKAIKLRENDHQVNKPRLLIIARKFTRSFMNINEIVKMAEEVGFEAVIAEAEVSSNLYKFARVVNSCDVIMGVHGAGLTNLVFLPANAVVIQIVPLGGLENIAWIDFGRPAMEMKMRYLQYGIGEEESSLIDEFDREGPVFRDPGSIQRQGWMALRKIYLDRQNVRLDVKRFRSVLVQAIQFLH
ncbi:protein O-linked-mannose beta-1,4-N-acetylglucosaminyltransferase 2-like [Phalaenopsis equestris]|uniref:protein O-linked-mannose beta-1,4-N-acetylglucosaminyltransferase 2-like n=1 Tax=Phalaenopsis equestris TaxID=78828 RepID=UPI0009E4A2E2|nr:protein O-linked-mannose beta-1,4-N-acetylglucosaminyltransferase 2-like [Phalaenopsis equestris]